MNSTSSASVVNGKAAHTSIGTAKDHLTQQNLKSITLLFKKDNIFDTKNFIEHNILGNRAPVDMINTPYISIWNDTIHALIIGQRNGTLEEKTVEALKTISKAIREYCKNDGNFTPALHKLPRELRKSPRVQKLLGTLFRNLPKITEYAAERKQINANGKIKDSKNKTETTQVDSVSGISTFSHQLISAISDGGLPSPGKANTKHYYGESGQRDRGDAIYVTKDGEIINPADARSRYDEEDEQGEKA